MEKSNPQQKGTLTMSQATAQVLATTPELADGDAKEYDYILMIDQSGSMGNPSTKMVGKDRWHEAQEFAEGFARYAEQHDDDGITLIKFNSHATVFDGVKADAVHDLFQKSQPGGSTNLAEALQKAWDKKKASSKKAIVVVITDGSPDDPVAVEKVIINAANSLAKDEELSFQFIQIGDDPGAEKFLEHLDNELTGKAKFDIVNTLSREDAESLTFGQMLWRAIND